MKIVIAPDSFKESLTAMAVANEIEAGFREFFPDAQYVKLPVADGGEGTVQAMIDASGGRRVALKVSGPLGEPVDAFYGLMGDGATAVIEMAAASGLELVPAARRDPLRTSSFGTGELIRDALDAGARRFVLGVGGSATNDGGAGMVQALGGRLLDEAGNELPPGGGALDRLRHIDLSGLDARIKDSVFDIACDVSNPLVGPQGASHIFGPQKGATPAMVEQLDANLRHYADVIARELGQQVADVPGAGAGGGIGAAMLVFLGGRLRPGSEIVTAAVGLDAAVADADLVITGEGRIDSQSIHGKTPIGVARVAQRHGKPVIAIAGSLAPGAAIVHQHGIQAVFGAVSRPCTVEQALAEAAWNVRSAARNIAAVLSLGARL
ncbi:glycerate kinase [Duganella sp. BJB488]|uniref:glycerate kinase n=1 Tax=unclassified Duganella TaxID=2636909 RepID=UPI000E3576C0|nr:MULTISPECIES: glycerate kinase [unclassified Duganella]RFP17661.1 glycerate kinase [Duganella sp. BJB489]RFP22170.1 glycerate kinase [Duganella sp. BJB488]RFP37505.1 glycerate kinase [Duganella sp. BJB480]